MGVVWLSIRSSFVSSSSSLALVSLTGGTQGQNLVNVRLACLLAFDPFSSSLQSFLIALVQTCVPVLSAAGKDLREIPRHDSLRFYLMRVWACAYFVADTSGRSGN